MATLIFMLQIKLTPMQKIIMEPIRERFIKADWVKNGSTKIANIVNIT